MATEDTLPAGFEDLLPYVSWALPTQSARSDKKMQSSIEEVTAFYDAGMRDGRVMDALRHCDQYPLDDMPADARRLFHLTLSIAEVRPQVEMYGQIDPPNAVSPSRLRMTPESDAR